MFRVEIKANDVLTNYSEFITLNECNSWIEDNSEFFPIGFSSQIIDITDLKRKIKKREIAQSKIDFGSYIISEIISINEDKYENGLLNDSQFEEMMNDPTLFKIERLLWNGSLRTALRMILSLNDYYFTSNNKQIIINEIQQFLLSIDEGK